MPLPEAEQQKEDEYVFSSILTKREKTVGKQVGQWCITHQETTEIMNLSGARQFWSIWKMGYPAEEKNCELEVGSTTYKVLKTRYCNRIL